MRLPFLRRQPQAPPRHLIVGLGNPGAQYQNTRHNVGFRVVDRLAELHRIDVRAVEKRALVGYGSIDDVPVVLAKPQTYMNLSGESVAPLLRMLQLGTEDLIVVTDDMDLPMGRLRIRREGSAGGHNGLKSLIQHLDTQEFARVRLGVGRPAEGGAIGHVLGKFERDEIAPVQELIHVAADAIETILAEGVDAAMGRYNIKREA